MTQLEQYSHDYTLKWLIEVWYLTQEDLDKIIALGNSKEEIIKAIEELLYQD